MAKLLMVYVMVILALTHSGSATNYMVGDNSGWDISTDLNTWLLGKRFLFSDVLLFQFSMYHSVYEVTKENFDRCNITNALKSSSKGNISFPLTEAGDSYFICGNRLHCLGGMKLHVNVEDNNNNNRVASPVVPPVPQAGGSNFPTHSSKNNNPSTIVPNLSNHVGLDYSILMATLGVLPLVFWLM